MNENIFREYDIRGVVDTDLTDETVYALARAIGTFLRSNGATKPSIGRDARESSPRFREIMVRGLTETGCDVLDVGMVPTPVLYYTLFTQGVDSGVMITGSHNPADNNGFKICLGKSTIHGEQISEIKDIALSGRFENGNGKKEERDDRLSDCVVDLTQRVELADGARDTLVCDQESEVVVGESDDSSNPIEFITENGFSIVRPWEAGESLRPAGGRFRFCVNDGFIEPFGLVSHRERSDRTGGAHPFRVRQAGRVPPAAGREP